MDIINGYMYEILLHLQTQIMIEQMDELRRKVRKVTLA